MTTLANKLHLKPGMTICVLAAPADYRSALGPLPEGVTEVKTLGGDLDVLQLFVTKRGELEKKLPSLKARLEPHERF
jgi:hypothetical protein